MDHHETGEALDALVDSGKVRAVGVSNFRPWDWNLLQSAMRHSLVTNQIELSLKEISPFTNGDLAFHQQHGHAVMAWSPLGGGDLMTGSGELADRLDAIARRYDVDRAAVATAFLLAHPAKITPLKYGVRIYLSALSNLSIFLICYLTCVGTFYSSNIRSTRFCCLRIIIFVITYVIIFTTW